MKSKHKTILTVDDTPANIRLLTHYLEKQGYRVITAEDGFEGFKAAIQYHPDLVLLDIMMPGTDGYEVCELLKAEEETREIPVVFLTAKADVEDKVRGYELGAVDYITKPFNLIEIATRVQTQLELRDLQDQCRKNNQTFIELQTVVNAGKVCNRLVQQFDKRLHDLNGQLAKIRKNLINDGAETKSLDSIKKDVMELEETAKRWIQRTQTNKSERVTFDVGQLLDEAIEIAQDNSHFSFDVAFEKSEKAPMVSGEYGLLKHALVNLLSSCQLMADTGGQIDIKVTEGSRPSHDLMQEKAKKTGNQYMKIVISSDVQCSQMDFLNEQGIGFLFQENSNIDVGMKFTAAYDIIKEQGGILEIQNAVNGLFNVSVFLPCSIS
jgi:DNA-binding response OmpR family regulator